MSRSMTNLTPEHKRQLLAQLLQKKAQQSTLQRFPLSFAQQRLWFIEQLQQGTAVYVIPAVLRLAGPLRVEELHHSLNAIAQRHAILRTRFITDAGQPYQQVEPSIELPLPVCDLSQVSDAEVQSHIQTAITQPFDLSQAPLWRCQLLKTAPDTHLLIVGIHHIVADYWSLRVLMAEIAALYTAKTQQRVADLPKLSIQYVDYAAWQRQQLDTPSQADQPSSLERQLDYWKQQLNNPPPLLDLPTDYSRPAVQSFRGARQSFALAPDCAKTLKALAQKQQVTLFMLLLATFQVLLHRYTQQTDIWVGSTVTNRDRRETQNLIGLFVNNLVFRGQASSDLPFDQFLQQVRETALDAYAHQDVPFEAIVDALQVERHLSHNALFQVMFILHNTPTQTFTLPDLQVTALEPDTTTARFDLSLDMYETPSGLTGVFEYNTDLFKPATIQRLVGHFQTLLGAIATTPTTPIGTLPLLTPAEHQQFAAWNQTEQTIPDCCVHERIADQAQANPDATAVIFEDVVLSYQDLEQQANQLAYYLMAKGVQPGNRIALCLERSAELVITLLAILKAGATYLPLDPAYPAERLRFILDDADMAMLIVARGETVGSAHPTMPTTLVLDLVQDAAAIAATSPAPLPPAASDTLAYLIYTSGSTGTPKGVPIRHYSLTNLLWSMAHAPGMNHDDTLLAVTTPAFDIAALELFLPLITGGTLVIANHHTTRDPELLAAQLEAHDITLMQATPATWRLLLESGWSGKANLKLLSGGEALDLTLAQQLLPCGQELWNLYGPTETTIWSAALKLEADTLQDGIVPLGPPITNTHFHVLDTQLRPVPLGVPGELYISGLGLSPGYRNRPQLTAQRFISSPLAGKTEDRTNNEQPTTPHPRPLTPHPHPLLYQTGDRVRRRDDGTLEYLGRLDHQVKLRGFRIELGEIETVLCQHPNVEQAVVVLRTDSSEAAKLVAYVVRSPEGKSQKAGARSNPSPTTNNQQPTTNNQQPTTNPQQPITNNQQPTTDTPPLRQYLANKLPPYMLPDYFVTIEELPLTPNGKVDRTAL
ncbi:amino acid adenylation domain-containing protein, partial [Oscillatoria sp. CS-180]|uniref:non-ribosomal peptide synthetase n=1 Tax=Oscillatoria sp. CS-180 TaxID=3021720 RepID=UPI00232F7731